MFAVEAYKEYSDLQSTADRIWAMYGDGPEASKAQLEADMAFEAYEYAAGIREIEDY